MKTKTKTQAPKVEKTKKVVADKSNRTLAEILHAVPGLPYATSALSEYIDEISKMNLIDIQEHAVSIGIRPSSDRMVLEKTLTNIFKSSMSSAAGLTNLANVKTKKPEGLLDMIKKGRK